MTCELCGEDFGKLVYLFPHMAERHPAGVEEALRAMDAFDATNGGEPEKIPVDPIY